MKFGFAGSQLQHGQMRLDSPATIVCTDADTYYKITGTFVDSCNHGFTVDSANNRLVHNWQKDEFLFNGTSEVSANKACHIIYAMYLNGSLVSGATTEHTFPASARTATLAITRLCECSSGDYIEVWVKSDTTSTTLTVDTLNITFAGMRL